MTYNEQKNKTNKKDQHFKQGCVGGATETAGIHQGSTRFWIQCERFILTVIDSCPYVYCFELMPHT